MRKIIFIICVTFIIFYNHSTLLLSQETTNTTNNNKEINFLQDALKIYIGCNSCDLDFIKEQVTFVNYVRDRSEADVHILYTTQYTGGSGKKYAVEFIGKNKFLGVNDTLSFITEKNETEKITREKVIKTLKLGLIKYVSKTPLSQYLEISFSKNEENKDEGEKKIVDKWNNWVFSISANSWLNGDKNANSMSIWSSVDAKRITKELKLYSGFYGNYNENYGTTNNSLGFYSSIIHSINSNWSYGFWLNRSYSEYRNIDFDLSISTGIEYNIFPYSESNKKDFRFQYKITPQYNDYIEETIYNKKSEALLKQSLSIETKFVKEWGEINIDIELLDILYLNDKMFGDLDKYRITLKTDTEINLFKGFSINFSGKISSIHDQLSLIKGSLTDEQIYLNQKEQSTDYDYWASVGFSYTFGSIYNNIVNPRF